VQQTDADGGDSRHSGDAGEQRGPAHFGRIVTPLGFGTWDLGWDLEVGIFLRPPVRVMSGALRPATMGHVD
jgi:hypothetical protein